MKSAVSSMGFTDLSYNQRQNIKRKIEQLAREVETLERKTK